MPMCDFATTPTPDVRPPASVGSEGFKAACQPSFPRLDSCSPLASGFRPISWSRASEALHSDCKYLRAEDQLVVLQHSTLNERARPFLPDPGQFGDGEASRLITGVDEQKGRAELGL